MRPATNKVVAPDTIFALSSGAPPAGIAVVRISGPDAGAALDRMSRGARPDPRRAVLRTVRDPDSGEMLDRALLLWMPGPATASGEDMVEFHLHGGRAVVTAVTAALGRLPGLRPAEAGEFTRRAFANGRIDLIEAEALGDLLSAETEAQRRNAMLLAGGALGRAIGRWQEEILRLSALVEAQLDFGDEDDVGPACDDITDDIQSVRSSIASWLAQPPVERLRDGLRLVIAGPPNAGKSTLLNALAGRDAAIVTSAAGTTRDLVEVPAAIDGIAFLLTDTAGLRDAPADEAERIGIDRAGQAIALADILLWLGDPDQAPVHPELVRVGAKADLRGLDPASVDVTLSAVTGEGMEALRRIILGRASALLPGVGDAALSMRQRDGLVRAGEALALGAGRDDWLLAAESLRLARMALDEVTGRAGIEDMLDALFGRFCIGK